MSKPTVPDLKELFRQASEIAKQVPESMQEAAFNRALDMLAGPSAPLSPQVHPIPKKTAAPTSTESSSGEEDSRVDLLMSSIDSTQHPGVRSATKVLDRSLMVLQIALNDHGVDGLIPSEIAQVLTEKFRISTKDSAVRMALGGAPDLVNRTSSGMGYLYKIMEPGLTYLSQVGSGSSDSSSVRPQRTSRSTARKPRVTAKRTTTSKNSEAGTPTTKAGVTKGGPRTSFGPKAAILSLISAGYFDQPRTGPEVQAQLKVKNGFKIGVPQLSLAMLRLVRTNDLDRDQNGEGQYEYRKKT